MDKINEHLQGSTFLLGMCLLLCVPWLQFQNKDKCSRNRKKKNGKARDLRVFACAFKYVLLTRFVSLHFLFVSPV